MKKLIGIILLISMLTLPSCAILNEGIFMPSIKTDQVFENETWLVVEDRLINKIDGTVYSVNSHFNQKSNETLVRKIERIIFNFFIIFKNCSCIYIQLLIL